MNNPRHHFSLSDTNSESVKTIREINGKIQENRGRTNFQIKRRGSWNEKFQKEKRKKRRKMKKKEEKEEKSGDEKHHFWEEWRLNTSTQNERQTQRTETYSSIQNNHKIII